MRSRRASHLVLALALLPSCAAPDLTGLHVDDADEPSLLWAVPDSVAVGAVASVHAMGCIPTSEVCIFPVRDLRWAVADTLVAQLAPRTLQPAYEVRVTGRRPGSTSVVVTSGSGRRYEVPIRVFQP